MFSLHNHTGISSASRGFADSSIKLKDLVIKSKELGLNGIAITDHEAVGGFVQAKKMEKEIDFPVICGNEIYLVSDKQYDTLKNDYESGMYFPHFLLLAKDLEGNKQLRELSTIAWEYNAFIKSGLFRTPTKMSDLENVIGNNKGHLIGSTACIGGQVGRWILDILNDEVDAETKTTRKDWLLFFLDWCKNLFGEDNFYLECQPATEEQQDQIKVNNYILQLSKDTNTPYIITTDSHYLSKDLFNLHNSFLNSSDDSDREVESFYKTAYLMNEEEIINYFLPYWDIENIKIGLNNTDKIGKRCERYSLEQKQRIPKIKLDANWKISTDFFPKTEYIQKYINSPFEQDRYTIYKLEKQIKKLIDPNDYELTFSRLESELEEIWHVSKIINDRLAGYFVTMSKLIEIIWTDGDSIVCPGRGSGVSSIINYLLEITQVNPLKMPIEMPFYRFISRERAEMADIDIDTQSNRRQRIFKAVEKYFRSIGGEAVNCCTYGTVGSKSAIITACRGLGISELSQEISALIPIERGFNWPLNDCYYGNEKLNRKPITEFKNIVNKCEGLWELATMIEGVIISRGTHASGVFMTNEPFTNYNAKMRSPDGTLISQFELHDSEFCGLIKYDFLTTSAMTKIRLTLDMLCENGYIEQKSTLKDTYMDSLNPHTLDYNYDEIWELVANNSVSDLFQFDSQVAMNNVSQIKPTSLLELAQTNSLMRLQGGEDEHGNRKETPTERYVRYKGNINEWYKDMDLYGVPKQDQKIIEKVLLQYNGVADTQEALMLMSREVNHFSIGEAHNLRSVIGKKKMKEIPALKEFFFKKGFENGINKNTLNYLWEEQVSLQLGYAFSILHCIAYTFVALQELVLYHKYPSIYWNCACLTVNSGGEEFSEDDDEYDDDELFFKKDKNKSTNYGKIATAIGQLQSKNVIVSLPAINKAKFGFSPDEENNEIIFGLKGISGVGDDAAYEIINNRPYNSLEEFHKKVVEVKKPVTLSTGKIQNKSLVPLGSTISLIKAGAFDKLEPTETREEIMKDYLKLNYPDKQTLDLRATESVMDLGIVPEKHKLAIRVNGFKNYVVTNENFIKDDEGSKTKKWYILRGNNESTTQMTRQFFEENFISNMTEGKDYYYNEQGYVIFACKLKSTGFEKTFDELTKDFKQWLKSSDCLDRYNKFKFDEIWNKHASGSISKWEMESLSFYYHEHELAKVDKEKYYISNFSDLSEEPEIESYGRYKDREYPLFKLDRIAGTVLDKNKNKHMITLLTINGEVVTLKFYKGQFGFYDKTISEQNIDGSKTTIEDSWFKRGNLLLVTGYRRGDVFKPKKYKDSAFQHTVALIEDVRDDGVLMLKTDRTKI